MSIKRNTLWNLVGAGAPILLGVVTIPFLLRQIGVEAFGILTLIWALIGYFSLFDFGLGRALTQKVATNLATESVDQLPSLVKSGLLFTLATGMIGAALLAVIAYPLGYHWLKVSQSLQENTSYSLIVAAIGIPFTTVTTGLRGVIEAYEDFFTVNLLRILLGLANFGFPVISVIIFGKSLVLIVTSLVIARLLVLVAHVYLVDKKMPSRWMVSEFRWNNMRALTSLGAWMTVSNIIGPLMVTADRFIISSILGATLVAYYTVPFDALIRLLIVPGAITAALFPRLASISVSDRLSAQHLYKKCLKVVSAVMFPVVLTLASGSYWILKLWLGQTFAGNSWRIFSIIAVGVFFNSVAQIPFAAIQSTGNARVTALIHVVEIILYIPLLVLFLRSYGLTGAALMFGLRACFDSLILMFYAKRCML
jgi:O-antigen/teichoic acid export membrane protein